MKIFFSPGTKWFYSSHTHNAENMPADVIEISLELHATLLEGESNGKVISADKKGNPILIDPPPPPPPTADDIRALRSMDYRNESDPLYMEWQFDQTPEAEAAWRSKVEEIKARHPMPDQ
jgi:hypothetical protein